METRDTLHDYPVLSWVIGAVLLVFAAVIALNRPTPWLFMAAFVGLSLVLFLFSSILTIRVDRARSTLTLSYRSLLRHRVRVLLFSDIAAVRVERTRSRTRSGSSYTYRVVIQHRDGKTLPLRTAYSSGAASKERTAQKLREWIGGAGYDNFSGIPQDVSQIAQQRLVGEQEPISDRQAEEQSTDGVHWKLQTRALGAAPVTRWVSPDFKFPGRFLYLTQKMQGQKSPGGLMASLSKTLFKQSLVLYGFGKDDTPGLEFGELYTGLNPRLEPHFLAFTNDPQGAPPLLNGTTVVLLAQWAERHPLKQGNTNQLAVLYGPQGVTLAMLGHTSPEHLDELAVLGTALVRTQAVG